MAEQVIIQYSDPREEGQCAKVEETVYNSVIKTPNGGTWCS